MSDRQRWTFSIQVTGSEGEWQESRKSWETRNGAMVGAAEWIAVYVDKDGEVSVKFHKAEGPAL